MAKHIYDERAKLHTSLALRRGRLQKPVWSRIEEGKWTFWRKGRTNQFIQIDAGPGSSIAVDAGKEDGDSEGNEHPKSCRE